MLNMFRSLQLRLRRSGISVKKFPAGAFNELPVFQLAVRLLMATASRPLRFVQIGANDGLFGDPLRAFVIDHGWSGVLVEPQPDVFAALKKNYAAQAERLHFVNVAISGDNTTLALYRPPAGSLGDTVYEQSVVSADAKVTARQLKVPATSLERIDVPCMTLDAVFEQFGMTDCDVLQIDVEGLDWQVLSTLDLTRFAPTIIQFEMGHLSVRHCRDVAAYLTQNDYSLFWPSIGGDAVAIKQPFFAGANQRPA